MKGSLVTLRAYKEDHRRTGIVMEEPIEGHAGGHFSHDFLDAYRMWEGDPQPVDTEPRGRMLVRVYWPDRMVQSYHRLSELVVLNLVG